MTMGVFIQVNEDSPAAEKYPLGYVVQENGCWEWVGHCGWNGSCQFPGRGYGAWKGQPAHRVMYEKYKGPIPLHLEIDHLCRNRACVNPDHLEAVTHAENARRVPHYVRMHWHEERKRSGWLPYREFIESVYDMKALREKWRQENLEFQRNRRKRAKRLQAQAAVDAKGDR